jgi:hypothetical protein
LQPSRTQMNGWSWFGVWVLLGAAAALGFVSFGPLLLVPVLALGVFLWTRPRVRRAAFGLLTGAGLLLLYVAWVQRNALARLAGTRRLQADAISTSIRSRGSSLVLCCLSRASSHKRDGAEHTPVGQREGMSPERAS